MMRMAAVAATESRRPDCDEAQMLARLRAGDRRVLDCLFRMYRAVAYRVAFRLLGNEADALDAVQNAFVKVFTHLDGFEGRSSFKTWLLRIVSNAALDLGRRRRRRNDLRSDDGSVDLATALTAPEKVVGQELELKELRQLLDEGLMQLSEVQRRTFVLHVDGELSYREVADVMQISVGTVMSRLFYARKKLQRVLSERWPQ
jgi:RNA polymerase sigma-70 factor (ECF subfamily)